ncbi:MAG: hypothetical protein WAK21_08650, partial [Candidatus Sulfotelmatobacter sp.]
MRSSAARNASTIIFFVIGAVTIGIAKSQSGAESQTAAAPKTAKQQFKNIQVLKDIPADQLVPT